MAPAPGGDAVERLVQLCSAGLDVDELRRELMVRLPRVLTVDATFFATVDPATLLFTSGLADEQLRAAAPAFLANELDGTDVNQFAALADTPGHVRSLDQATRGTRTASHRYRDLMAPIGLGDELRAALVVDGRCWGALCLHREDAAAGFSARDIAVVRRLVPHLARGLRRAMVMAPRSPADVAPARPGVVVIGPEYAVLSMTAEAAAWCDLLDPAATERGVLPLAVRAAVAEQLHSPGAAGTTEVTLRAPAGQWVTVTSSPLSGAEAPNLAVVLAAAPPRQLTSALLAGYGFTPAQLRVTELVLRGRSTRQIVGQLYLSEYTVQEYLRAVFDKVGVNSRRELMAALLPG